MSPGFEIETELTVTSLVYRYHIANVPITYRDRPEGSSSKLSTFRDGFKVLVKLFDLWKDFISHAPCSWDQVSDSSEGQSINCNTSMMS